MIKIEMIPNFLILLQYLQFHFLGYLLYQVHQIDIEELLNPQMIFAFLVIHLIYQLLLNILYKLLNNKNKYQIHIYLLMLQFLYYLCDLNNHLKTEFASFHQKMNCLNVENDNR